MTHARPQCSTTYFYFPPSTYKLNETPAYYVFKSGFENLLFQCHRFLPLHLFACTMADKWHTSENFFVFIGEYNYFEEIYSLWREDFPIFNTLTVMFFSLNRSPRMSFILQKYDCKHTVNVLFSRFFIYLQNPRFGGKAYRKYKEIIHN